MIVPIVLAAGLGTRMGAIKALIPIGEKPALAMVLNTIASAGLPSPRVVLGRDAQTIQDEVRLDYCDVLINEHPEEGLSSSMKLALRNLPDSVTGILVFHVDMPFLAKTTLQSLLNAIAKGATMAAPYHRSVRGFPVYFDHSLVRELGDSLKGDRGGRQFLDLHKEDLTPVVVDDPGCIFDLDCPADIEAWKGERLCTTKES